MFVLIRSGVLLRDLAVDMFTRITDTMLRGLVYMELEYAVYYATRTIDYSVSLYLFV